MLPELHTSKLVFSFVGEFAWLYCVIGHPQEKEQKTQDYFMRSLLTLWFAFILPRLKLFSVAKCE